MNDEGFTVDRTDLRAASYDFWQNGNKVQALMGGRQLPCPRGGANDIDQIMEETLAIVSELRIVLSEVLNNHGRKLEQAAYNYDAAEEKNLSNITDIVTSLATGNTAPDYQHAYPGDAWARPRSDIAGDQGLLTGSSAISVPRPPGTAGLTSYRTSVLPTPPGEQTVQAAPPVSLRPPQQQKWPLTCLTDMVGGDFDGMAQLARKLWEAGTALDGIVGDLVFRVERLCADTRTTWTQRAQGSGGKYAELIAADAPILHSDGGWSGPAAGAFQAAYEQDSSSLYQLGVLCVNAGSAINDLAYDLSVLESKFENVVRTSFRALVVPTNGVAGVTDSRAAMTVVVPANGTMPGNFARAYTVGESQIGRSTAPFQSDVDYCGRTYAAAKMFRAAADRRRKVCAVELAALDDSLSTLLDWYVKSAAICGPSEGQGLLTGDELNHATKAEAALVSTYGPDLTRIHASQSELEEAKSALESTGTTLTLLGGYAAHIKSIAVDVRTTSQATGFIAKLGGAAASIAPDIGAIAEDLAPIIVIGAEA